jgi:CheY-like chemotaxis protein
MENIKMLLAEDDEDDRSFFQQALLESGIGSELTVVSDGWQLIEFLLDQQNPGGPDIIFLDINMPGMDGKSCLREIRRQVKFVGIPIIILSTSTRVSDIEETYKDGANRYFSKMLFYNDAVGSMRRLFDEDWRQALVNPTREAFGFIDLL